MRYLVFIWTGILLVGCQQEVRTLYDIKKNNELRIIIRNSPSTYFEDRDGAAAGFEYEMVQAFAKWLKVKTKIITVDSTEKLLDGLRLNRADIAIGSLTITKSRQDEFLFSDPYMEVNQDVVCHKSVLAKSEKDLLSKKIIVPVDTSYVDSLETLKKNFPNLTWNEEEDEAQEHIFELIQDKQFDCTIIDSNIRKLNQRFYPDIRFGFVLGKRQEVAWAMTKENEELKNVQSQWFKSVFKRNALSLLKDKYYATTQDFDPYDINKLNERIKTRLPEFKTMFINAAKKIGWDWKLLAAISYQESHWNPKAISPTGVRGLMMLTRATAKAMGVKNRIDPQESIEGGAKYLAKLSKRLPSYIDKTSRLWMTLASYNVGYAHLRDARGLAAWKEKNPNTWSGVRKVLPLLAEKRYYKRLPHGYARGKEPVVYVDRIKNYYDLIQKAIDGTVKVKIYR